MLSPGVYLTHKPKGPSSFAHFKQALGLSEGEVPKKACHGGTLDPFAEGLLILLVGPATHFFELLHELPKTYEAEVVWGEETDNADFTGKVVFRGDTATLTPEALETALASHLGWQEQTPPSTSAKKVGGEPAYKKVHRGESVTLPPSKVYLHEAHWLSHSLPHSSRLKVVCRGGYYIRSLVRDLGRQLGTGAYVKSLFRTQIGPWACPPSGQTVSAWPLLPFCPQRHLSDAEMGQLRKHEAIETGSILPVLWQVPPGFPALTETVLAWHQQRCVALLQRRNSTLETFHMLPKGLQQVAE